MKLNEILLIEENDDVNWDVSHSGKKFIGFHVPHPKRGIMTYDKQKGLELQKKRVISLIQKNLKLKPTDKIEFNANSEFISYHGVDVTFKINDGNIYNLYQGGSGFKSSKYYIELIKKKIINKKR